MNIKSIAEKLRKYFVYTGVAHKFNEGGLFADINLEAQLSSFQNEYQSSESFKGLIDYIDEWSGEFKDLYTYNRALSELSKKILKTDLSQNVIIKKWYQYCELKGEESPKDLIDNGFCAGLSYASSFEYFLDKFTKLEKSHPVFRLNNFEKIIIQICQWDGKALTPEIEACFETLKQFALPLQDKQADGFNAISDIVPLESLPQTHLRIAFVHNLETLRHKFTAILQPGNVVRFGASRHAARAYVTQDKKIIYYNPNEDFGYLQFDLSHLDYFLEVIPQGFQGCYVERFALNTDVYCLNETHGLKFSKLFGELLDIAKGDKMDYRDVVNATDSKAKTALILACDKTNPEEVERLLKLGVNVNLADVEGSRAIHFAALRGNPAVLELLLSDPMLELNILNGDGLSALHIIATSNHAEAARLIINDEKKRARLNLKSSIRKSKDSPYEATALYYAVYNDSNDVAELLIAEPEVKVNEPETKTGKTPLHVAAGNGNLALTRSLLKRVGKMEIDLISKETNALYPSGMTALCYAMEHDQYDVAVQLFIAGADIKFLPMDYRWLLMRQLLTECNPVEFGKVISEKIKSGDLTIDLDDPYFIAFLNDIIFDENKDILRQMLQQSPDITDVMFTEPEDEESVSEAENPKDEIVDSKGSKAKLSFACTTLQTAVLRGSVEVVRLLLNSKPELINKKDNHGGDVYSYLKFTETNKSELRTLLAETTIKMNMPRSSEKLIVSDISMFKRSTEPSTTLQEKLTPEETLDVVSTTSTDTVEMPTMDIYNKGQWRPCNLI